jgi:hypothetical protein
MSVVELTEVSKTACSVIPTVTSQPVRQCTDRADSVLSMAQISTRRLEIPCVPSHESGWSVCRLWSQQPPKCLWYSVVTFCQQLQRSMEMAASVRRRLRSGGNGKRSSAQTITLRPEQCRAESLAIEGPSAGGGDGYLQQLGYAIASDRSYRVSPAPCWPW